MRFAIIGSRGYPSTYGGYETLVRSLAPHLVGAGHAVTVYCRGPYSGRWRWASEDVDCVWTPGLDSKSLSTLTFGMSATLDAGFRRFDSALVLNIANGFWLPILRVARIPSAVNTDGLEWERGKWTPLGRSVFRAGARMTARHADMLICDSQAIAGVWTQLFRRQSTFIPYGAPVLDDVGHDLLDAMGLGHEPYVLVVARLVPENNVDLTLDALDLLGERRPHVVIVGTANADSPIEARLKAMQGSSRVSWLGHVDDQRLLTQLWANCSVYVHGHSVGGTNPALLQALGAGAPTLALDTPFNAEVLPQVEQRFPHDPRVLADLISSTAESEHVQREMAKHGRSIIRERYSWHDVCEAYTDALLYLARHGGLPKGRKLSTYREGESTQPASQREAGNRLASASTESEHASHAR
jgi:glycosyltransferase involved in cell wall biosynthesis